MNARTRKIVSDLTSKLEALRGELEDVGAQLSTIAEAKQEEYEG
jgi:NTP pyrophosphatase (non-canonical NTP hydrolase)